MSDTPTAEALFGLPDLSKYAELLKDAKEFFEAVKAFYEAHKADIEAIVAFVKQLFEFINGLRGGTGGGFVGQGA